MTSGTLNLPDGVGKAGEAAAAGYLRRSGFDILATNYRVREGEIDIIARRDGQIVFVEVKTRRNSSFGRPEESLSAVKSERLKAAAQSYLIETDSINSDWRIDLLVIELNFSGALKRAELIEHAVTD